MKKNHFFTTKAYYKNMWDCGSRPVKIFFENKNPDNRKKFLFGIFRTIQHRFLGIFQGPIQLKNIVEKVEKRKNRPEKITAL